jgi:uncharacterized membrane protein YgdD (TMEM256/DUF423 family)
MVRTFAVWGAALALFAVAFGAFGAHALKDRLSAESLGIYQTGVQYHMAHALALLLVASLAERLRLKAAVGWLFVVGVLIFSGSLYLLAITGQRWFGAITPLGGLCFLAGWAVFAFDSLRSPQEGEPRM